MNSACSSCCLPVCYCNYASKTKICNWHWLMYYNSMFSFQKCASALSCLIEAIFKLCEMPSIQVTCQNIRICDLGKPLYKPKHKAYGFYEASLELLMSNSAIIYQMNWLLDEKLCCKLASFNSKTQFMHCLSKYILTAQ